MLYKPKAVWIQTATVVTRSVVWYVMVRTTYANDFCHIRSMARYGMVRTVLVLCKPNSVRTQTAPVVTQNMVWYSMVMVWSGLKACYANDCCHIRSIWYGLVLSRQNLYYANQNTAPKPLLLSQGVWYGMVWSGRKSCYGTHGTRTAAVVTRSMQW